MVRPEGVEPPTYWFVASCSIQLSYGRTLLGCNCFSIPDWPVEINLATGLGGVCGAPGRIRTSDPLVRSQMLYPTELRARGGLSTDDCTAGRGLPSGGPTSQRRDVGYPVWSQSRVGVCLPADPHLRGEMWGTRPAARGETQVSPLRTHDEAVRSSVEMTHSGLTRERWREGQAVGDEGQAVGARVRLWGWEPARQAEAGPVVR